MMPPSRLNVNTDTDRNTAAEQGIVFTPTGHNNICFFVQNEWSVCDRALLNITT